MSNPPWHRALSPVFNLRFNLAYLIQRTPLAYTLGWKMEGILTTGGLKGYRGGKVISSLTAPKYSGRNSILSKIYRKTKSSFQLQNYTAYQP